MTKLIITLAIVSMAAAVLIAGCKKDQEPAPFTDIEGNVYKTVTIGTQVWMQENLKTTKLNEGTSIPIVTDNSQWANLKTAGVCFLNNDETTNKDKYGALYNWYTVKTGNLCPFGWHVPSNDEVNIMFTYVGGPISAWEKLLESGTAHWIEFSNPSTNESGFTALPGRQRFANGSFTGVQEVAIWWTSNENNIGTSSSWYATIGTAMLLAGNAKETGFSIRCVKN